MLARKAPTLYSKMCCGCHVKRERERASAAERARLRGSVRRERALPACVLQFKMSLKSAALHSLIVKREAKKKVSTICLCSLALSLPRVRYINCAICQGFLQFYRASSYANNNLQKQQTNARRGDDDGANTRHDATRGDTIEIRSIETTVLRAACVYVWVCCVKNVCVAVYV